MLKFRCLNRILSRKAYSNLSNFTTKTRLFQLLCAPLLIFLDEAIRTHNTDTGYHKFSTRHHLLLSLVAHLTGAKSSNALLEELNDVSTTGRDRNLREMIGFDYLEHQEPVTLHQSSFSRANQNRSYRLWRYCFHQLWKLAKAECHPHQLAGLGQILAVDGSLFKCLDRMLWATYRSTSHKVRGHFFFDLDGLPEKLILTAGTGSERDVLSQHIRLGLTYVFDRGYNDYDLFRQFTKLGSYFVTRLLKMRCLK